MAKKKAAPSVVDNYELPAVTNEQAKAEAPVEEAVKVVAGDVSQFLSKNGGSPTIEQIDHAINLYLTNKNSEMFVGRISDLAMYASGDELTTIESIKALLK